MAGSASVSKVPDHAARLRAAAGGGPRDGAHRAGGRLKILVAVCNEVLRSGLSQVLQAAGHTVREHAARGAVTGPPDGAAPDAVLACVDGCGMLAVTEALRRTSSRVGVVCLVSARPGAALEAARMVLGGGGSGGFSCLSFDRQLSLQQLLTAVRRVAAGDVVLNASTMTALLSQDAAQSQRRLSLTRRERDVLELASLGYRNAAIAQALVVTERAVEKTLNVIYRKLDVIHDERINRRVLAARMWLELQGGNTSVLSGTVVNPVRAPSGHHP